MSESWHQTRKTVLDRDGHECRHCGEEERAAGGVGLHVHHIKMRDAGGSDDPSNLITLCEECHNRLHRCTNGEIRHPGELKKADDTPPEEIALTVLKNEGRVNPFLIREATGLGKGTVNRALRHLTAAGKAKKVVRGLYDYTGEEKA